jgi:hypothetical protein
MSLRDYILLVEEASKHKHLWHGTSTPSEIIKKQGLKSSRQHSVFLTDNPELAIEYAESDQNRTGNDDVVLVTVDVSKLDHSKLIGDIDHTNIEDWQESLLETDQCMYMGDITLDMITAIEDLE